MFVEYDESLYRFTDDAFTMARIIDRTAEQMDELTCIQHAKSGVIRIVSYGELVNCVFFDTNSAEEAEAAYALWMAHCAEG